MRQISASRRSSQRTVWWGQRDIHQFALSQSGGGARPVRFEHTGRFDLLLAPDYEDALPGRDVSVPAAGGLSDRRPERDADARNTFLLHGLSDHEVLDVVFRRAAILGYDGATSFT